MRGNPVRGQVGAARTRGWDPNAIVGNTYDGTNEGGGPDSKFANDVQGGPKPEPKFTAQHAAKSEAPAPKRSNPFPGKPM